jgi:hypothetical protein
MARNSKPGWTFLTNHGQVMLCIADDSGIRLREIGERIGITERAAHTGELPELLSASQSSRPQAA